MLSGKDRTLNFYGNLYKGNGRLECNYECESEYELFIEETDKRLLKVTTREHIKIEPDFMYFDIDSTVVHLDSKYCGLTTASIYKGITPSNIIWEGNAIWYA